MLCKDMPFSPKQVICLEVFPPKIFPLKPTHIYTLWVIHCFWGCDIQHCVYCVRFGSSLKVKKSQKKNLDFNSFKKETYKFPNFCPPFLIRPPFRVQDGQNFLGIFCWLFWGIKEKKKYLLRFSDLYPFNTYTKEKKTHILT